MTPKWRILILLAFYVFIATSWIGWGYDDGIPWFIAGITFIFWLIEVVFAIQNRNR